MFEERIEEWNELQETIPAPANEVRKTVYTPEEIQTILGVSRPTVYKLIKEQQFRVLRMGRCIRVVKAEFDAWLDGPGQEA